MPEVRLIDANALIDELDIMIIKAISADTEVHYALIRELVAEQRTFEAEPVRHGRWVFQKGDKKETCDGWICTNCKYGFHTKVPYFEAFKYCPMCGARMDATDTNVGGKGGADNG